MSELTIEETIQNGVKHTEYGDWLDGDERFDDIIQNGVKETKTPGEDGDIMGALDFMSDNNTNNLSHLINDVIEKGIKQTEAAALFDETKVDRIISEGVKETKGGGYLGSIEMKGKMVHQLESPKQNNEVEEVIEHGVKLTNSSLQIDGSCVVEDVIQNGIKETHDDVYHHKGRVDGVIRNGIKETWGYEKQPQKRIDEVIMNGQKD
jgi:predicted peroxiredoxin